MGSPGLGLSAVLMSSGLRFCLRVWVCVLSHFNSVQLFSTPWTVAHQAPLSMGFSRQYWSGLPYSFFRRVSQPRNRIHISCIAGGFFTHQESPKILPKGIWSPSSHQQHEHRRSSTWILGPVYWTKRWVFPFGDTEYWKGEVSNFF